MRQVQKRLRYALDGAASDLVEHDRQDDGHREAHQQVHKVQQQRVSQRDGEIAHIDDEFEVIKPHPGAARDAFEQIVLLKGDDDADHRLVAEDEVIGDREHQHQVQAPVPGDQLAEGHSVNVGGQLLHAFPPA